MQDRSAVADAVTRACSASAGTVQALAEEVGVSYAALCSWSRERRHPPGQRLAKLAEVLDSRAERLQQIAAELRDLAGHTAATAAPGSAATPLAAPSAPLGITAARDQRTEAGSRSSRPWAQGLPDHTRTRDRAAAAPQLVDAQG
jgi:transcriptional regulator with XRE-family HTH domain